jgi:hypothetical protein
MTLPVSLAVLVRANGLRPVLDELVRAHGLLVVLEGLANVEGDVAEACMKRAENGAAYEHGRAASVIVQACRYIAHGSHGAMGARGGRADEVPEEPTEVAQPSKKKVRARASA